jgi:hypothetical protein
VAEGQAEFADDEGEHRRVGLGAAPCA